MTERTAGGPLRQPPWWPEGEPWPSRGEWSGGRRRFMRRVGCLALSVLLLFALVMFVAGIIFSPGASPWADDREGPPLIALPFWLLVILAIVGIVSIVRRLAGPVGDLMEAAERVADGDYTARVTPRGSLELQRLAHSFNSMTERLSTNDALRRQLLADIAHELRTPLAVVQGNIEGILDGVYPRDDDHLRPLLDETALMAHLLDDLRTLAMAEAGALPLHRESTDLRLLAGRVVAVLTPRATAAGVRLVLDADDLALDVDPVRIREVLENLLVNGLRHTPASGTVALRVRADAAHALLTVTDTGSGIAPEDLPHVFERLTKSADSGGSGLGLAIARRLVEAHGGTIVAESVVGQGTTMRVLLPLSGG